MHKISTFAIAVALGLAWTAFPAGAADDTLKNKAERTGDKIEDKAERAKDKIEDKSERAKDKIENKSERAKDKAEAKADRAKDKADAKGDTMGDKVDRAVDKTKAKTREMKDKVADKMHRGDKGDHMASGDTRSAQEALQAKGYNPGPIDGVYGPRTTAAVRDFQKAEGLKVTGRMDTDTRAKLMASSGAGSAPSASTTTTTTPSASPSTTTATPANPSSVGAPSQAPAPAPQRQSAPSKIPPNCSMLLKPTKVPSEAATRTVRCGVPTLSLKNTLRFLMSRIASSIAQPLSL